jgi:hypothetical protein
MSCQREITGVRSVAERSRFGVFVWTLRAESVKFEAVFLRPRAEEVDIMILDSRD